MDGFDIPVSQEHPEEPEEGDLTPEPEEQEPEEQEEAPVEPQPAVDVITQPAKPKLRRFPGSKNFRRTSGHRRVKMVRPICDAAKMVVLGLPTGDACQDPEKYRDEWWKTCTHNPYFSLTKRQESQPIFGPPNAAGEREVLSHSTREVYVERPNLVQVSLTMRHNHAWGPADAILRKGFVTVETLGIAPYCEYQDCWAHDPKFNTRHGNFCESWQAQIVAADAQGKILEVGAPNLPGSQEKRQRQLHEALPI